jgi:hypothetical protein
VVAPQAARAFHQQLQASYHRAPERLAALHLPDADHLLRASEWRQVTPQVVEWFSRFLPMEAPGESQGAG